MGVEIRKDDALDQLERILQSRAMRGSENLKSFLKFVVDKALSDSGDQMKEYTIATEVFGRSSQFSPRHDSVVRVQASRLRFKLQEYYATEGKTDRVIIDLPKGHYNPVFSLVNKDGYDEATAPKTQAAANGGVAQPLALPVENQTRADTRARAKGAKWITPLGVAVVVLVIAVIALVVRNRSLGQQARERVTQTDAEKAGPVWQPFLEAQDQTLLVLSNPAVYRFTNPKDPEVLLRDSITLTPYQIKQIEKSFGEKFMIRNGPGKLVVSADQFTGVGEAIGLQLITDLFRSVGRSVLLKQSRTVSAEDLKNHNVVLLGSMWVNEWSGKLSIKEDFAYTPNATIENQTPRAGEEQDYSPKFDASGRLIEDYALITVKPNISDKDKVMILAGIHSEGTQAAAEYATKPEYLNTLNQRLLQFSTAPKYYQALLKVAVDNGIPTTISLLSLHELRAPD